MTEILDRIETALRITFSPERLSVEDESHLHAGHRGASEHRAEHGSTPSHIHIEISAPSLASLSRLARHRAVMDAMGEDVAKLHAIRLTIQ